MSTSSTAPSNQLRVYVPRDTLVRLIELQARAVTTGLKKPSYSDLICAAVTTIDPGAVIEVLGRNGT